MCGTVTERGVIGSSAFVLRVISSTSSAEKEIPCGMNVGKKQGRVRRENAGEAGAAVEVLGGIQDGASADYTSTLRSLPFLLLEARRARYERGLQLYEA